MEKPLQWLILQGLCFVCILGKAIFKWAGSQSCLEAILNLR